MTVNTKKPAYFTKQAFLLTNINKEEDQSSELIWLEDLATTYSPAP